MNIIRTDSRGRKTRVGSVVFDNGRLAFFAGYHECICGTRGKVLLNIEDVRSLSRMGGARGKEQPIGARLTKKLARHYGL